MRKISIIAALIAGTLSLTTAAQANDVQDSFGLPMAETLTASGELSFAPLQLVNDRFAPSSRSRSSVQTQRSRRIHRGTRTWPHLTLRRGYSGHSFHHRRHHGYHGHHYGHHGFHHGGHHKLHSFFH